MPENKGAAWTFRGKKSLYLCGFQSAETARTIVYIQTLENDVLIVHANGKMRGKVATAHSRLTYIGFSNVGKSYVGKTYVGKSNAIK